MSSLFDQRQQGIAPASGADTGKDCTIEGSSRPPPRRRETSRYLALINGIVTLGTFDRNGSDSDCERNEEGLVGIGFGGGGGGKRRIAAVSKSRGRGMEGADRSMMSWRLGRSKKGSGQVCSWGMFNCPVYCCCNTCRYGRKRKDILFGKLIQQHPLYFKLGGTAVLTAAAAAAAAAAAGCCRDGGLVAAGRMYPYSSMVLYNIIHGISTREYQRVEFAQFDA